MSRRWHEGPCIDRHEHVYFGVLVHAKICLEITMVPLVFWTYTRFYAWGKLIAKLCHKCEYRRIQITWLIFLVFCCVVRTNIRMNLVSLIWLLLLVTGFPGFNWAPGEATKSFYKEQSILNLQKIAHIVGCFCLTVSLFSFEIITIIKIQHQTFPIQFDDFLPIVWCKKTGL